MSRTNRLRLAAFCLERAETSALPQWAAYWRAEAGRLVASVSA